jgi:hypothetical protein
VATLLRLTGEPGKPNFAIPAHNFRYAPELQDGVKAHYREMREQARGSVFGIAAPMPERSALEVDPERRRVRW